MVPSPTDPLHSYSYFHVKLRNRAQSLLRLVVRESRCLATSHKTDYLTTVLFLLANHLELKQARYL